MSDTPRPSPVRRPAVPRPPSARRADPRTSEDPFFRHIVSSMRNGVIAFHRDGTLALMNDEAYRIFGLTRERGAIGRASAVVLRNRPDVIRVLGSAFELSHLPNRAELRLKDLDRVIG